jgi:hypothetical protein
LIPWDLYWAALDSNRNREFNRFQSTYFGYDFVVEAPAYVIIDHYCDRYLRMRRKFSHVWAEYDSYSLVI